MTRKLLLVDENPQTLALIGDFLVYRGYDVHRARESDEAKALLDNFQYSLVITGTDWENFSGDGLSLTQSIRNLAYRPKIVFLEETGSASCPLPSPEEDATQVIEKPVSLLRLGDLMRDIISN